MNDMAELGVSIPNEILTKVLALGRNVSIYPSNHPMVMQPAEEIVKLLNSPCIEAPLCTFHVVNSELYFDGQLLPEETIKYSSFVSFLSERGINNFSISKKAEPQAIIQFFTTLSEDGAKGVGKRELRRKLEERQIKGIEFDSLVALDTVGGAYDLVKKESGEAATNSYSEAIDCLAVIEDDASGNTRHLNTRALQGAVTSLIENFLSDRQAIIGIMSIKSYDRHLFYHSVNVAVTALLIGKKLSLSDEQMKIVGTSGLLHDMGKLKLPREIISKTSRLAEEEWIMIRRHPIEGAQMLLRYENIHELAVLAAFEHHAGYDLSGYPSIKGKEHPHLLSRIVGIADVYEAMTANRSYRPAQTVDRAVRVIINGSGTQFDPLLVKLLLSITGAFPPGSLVRLNNGAAAVVVEPNEDNPFFPKVRMVNDFSTAAADAPVINTSDDPSQYAVAGVADSDEI